ncbi:hypothetical protein PMY56_16115 [Clostridium tertium]|nr:MULTISPECIES: hypothetical protein [Clostridium]MBS4959075.1 hypothetical protein [Clostridium sp.]MBS5308586.1 hypothetical protein [Clostridium sp.]MDB1923512.1 hypothetical protein [Clostridium tertium]MDB1927659.1 hypothetical protein [Clostridium tertium]MDB1931285.1 hypothetical protein [Clostridium tertium]
MGIALLLGVGRTNGLTVSFIGLIISVVVFFSLKNDVFSKHVKMNATYLF